jgi:hypothetical protein
MAERHNRENKRFAHRSPDKKSEPYVGSQNGSKTHVSSNIMRPPTKPSSQTLINPNTSHVETTTTTPRRVVVVRNSKNPQLKQRPIDLGDFVQSDSAKMSPVATNGVSILYIVLHFSEYILAYIDLSHSTSCYIR